MRHSTFDATATPSGPATTFEARTQPKSPGGGRNGHLRPQRLRIAQVAPLYENVPPTGYGGTERVIAGLCDGLVAAGHEVTLFAAGGSHTSARLEAVIDAPLRERMSADELAEVSPHLHLRMLSDIYARSDEFDLIHAHTDVWTLPFVERCATPTLITMHGRLDIPVAKGSLSLYPGAALVSISDDQRLALAGFDLDWLATVPNGLDLHAYHDQPRGRGEYLAFVGRLCPEKRPDIAVEVAARTGWPLRVAAKIDPCDERYFEEQIAPLFDAHDVEFVGELGERRQGAVLCRRCGHALPQRLARTIRSGHDRIARRRHAGHRLAPRFRPRGARRRPVWLHLRRHRSDDRRRRPPRPDRPRGVPSASGRLQRGRDVHPLSTRVRTAARPPTTDHARNCAHVDA